jgi:hypothetical protein
MGQKREQQNKIKRKEWLKLRKKFSGMFSVDAA